MRKVLPLLLLISLGMALTQEFLTGMGMVAGAIVKPLLSADEALSMGMVNAANSLISSTTGLCNNNVGVVESGIRLAYVAVVGVFLFMVAFHLLERLLLGESKISLWIKAEDAITTFLIVLVFHALFNLVGGTDYYFLKQSHEYVDRGIAILVNSYGKLIFINAVFSTLFTVDVPLYVKENSIIGASINMGMFAKVLTDSILVVANMVQTSLTEWFVRKLTLCVTPLLVLVYLFPLGVLLRSLYFTRGAGSAMLALAFAMYFFYPFLNFISYEIFKVSSNFFNPQNISSTGSFLVEMTRYIIVTVGVLVALKGVLGLAASWINRLSEKLGNTIRQPAKMLTSGPTEMVTYVYNAVVIAVTIGLLAGYVPNFLIDIFTFIIAFGIVMPAINIYLTLVLAIELSKVFGMQVDLTAFMRLI